MPKKKKAKPQLLVVFDTNVLYTQVASDLVRAEVRKLISENSSHSDIEIKWYLPSVVVDERRYQMRTRAFGLLPSLQKLERLIGHNLNITIDILIQRVNDAIQNEITTLNFNELSIDTKQIDWDNLIQRACFREPPFEPGEKEKGFRDSIIAEALFQLLSDSPSTPTVCRLVLVTDDNTLTEFVENKTSGAKNIRILSGINELESLINILVSSVTEDFVDEIKENARKYFFEKDDQNCYYFKENIGTRISEQYSGELAATPEADSIRENGTWWINPPVFVKKDKQRVYWFNQLVVDCKFYKYEFTKKSDDSSQQAGGLRGIAGLRDTPQSNVNRLALAGLLGDVPTKREIGEGKTIFEIQWSVNITPTKKLSRPKLENIDFIKNDWID